MVQPPEKRLVTEADLESVIAEYLGRAETKLVPHQVTGPMSSTSWPVTAGANKQGHVRFPVKFAADVSRFRVHVRNHSYADNQGYMGAVSLTSIYWGPARYNLDSDVDGGFAVSPTQIQGEVALPPDASEWISGWVEADSAEGADYILSLGWSTPSASAAANLVSGWAKHWSSAIAADAGIIGPSLTLMGGSGAPFDIWLECEVDAATPVIAFVGDSITVGNMHDESYPRRYGQLHRIWPAVFGHFGGMLNDWGNGSENRWSRYGPLDVDATFLLCGINDIFADIDVNGLKNRITPVFQKIRTYLGPRIIVGTILPSSGAQMTAPREVVRASHNNWLLSYRRGINGAVDLARVMATDAAYETPIPGMLWDNTHPGRAGQQRIAEYIPHLIR